MKSLNIFKIKLIILHNILYKRLTYFCKQSEYAEESQEQEYYYNDYLSP